MSYSNPNSAHESIFTKFYQNYILPTKFKIDKRKAHLSTLICSGQMSQEEALKKLEEPLYDPNELKTDKEYVLKKLGFTEEEFDEIMSREPAKHQDFVVEGPIEGHYPLLKPFKKIYRLLTIQYLVGFSNGWHSFQIIIHLYKSIVYLLANIYIIDTSCECWIQ